MRLLQIKNLCDKTGIVILFCLSVLNGVSQPVKRPAIIGIAAVELQVTDIKKAKVFYEVLLGYVCKPVLLSNNRHAFAISVNQRQTILLHDGLPAGQDERLLSFGLQVNDAEAMRLYLKSKSIAVPDSISRETTIRSFSVRDPDNHWVKFIQYIPGINNQAPGQTKPGKIISDRILHAGLTISNPSLANSFYQEVLEFSEIWRGGSTDSITSWINMRLPESTDYLEYMLISKTPNRQQLGTQHHIALLVPDIQKALDLLRQRAEQTGYDLGTPRIGRNNRWQLNLFDPDGTRIELMEPFTAR